MRLSILLELLLVFIIIAFGAANPVAQSVRRTKIETNRKVSLRKEETFLRKKETSEDEDYDGDEDDIFGLGSSSDKIRKETNQLQKPNTEEEDAPDDEKDSEEDVDDGEFLLFGEDLFGFFDDGNKTNKTKLVNKVSSTILPLNVVTAATLAPITQIKNENNESSIVSIGAVEEVVNQLTLTNSANKNSIIKPTPQLHLQHTTALLELAQNSGVHKDSTTMHSIQNIYEIYPTDHKFEIGTAVGIDFNKNSNEQSQNGETISSLPEYNPVLNILKVKKDTKVTDPIKTLSNKKQSQKQDNSFFSLVESLISGDDDDLKTDDENNSAETSEEDEEEIDNAEDTLVEESDEENEIKDKKKKKNRQA